MIRFFIDRPKFALVVSLVITLIGVLSGLVLPVEQLPSITPPVVSVTATYTGANSEVIAETVAAPIEAQVNGVDGMLFMSSNSADNGTYNLNITFALGVDPDMATVNVQNRISQATSQLPEEVVRNGITVQKASTNMLLVAVLYAPKKTYDEVFLANYASLNLRDDLARVPGVGKVDVMTDFAYGMRIWLDPQRLAGLGLTPSDFIQAIEEQNAVVAAGQIGAPPTKGRQEMQYTIRTKGRLKTAEEFGSIILRKGEDGALVRVRDVARVELGAEIYSFSGRFDRQPATVLAVYQAPGANALAVSKRVLKRLEALSRVFPEDIEVSVPFNTTDFVKTSLKDVVKTLLMTFILVVAVVFIFLGNWRATLIPAIAIPVSLIGTLAVLFILGFSLNTVSLFALVLAIGIVVDDAIVVVENVVRLLQEENLSPRAATLRAMEQMTGPVIATTLVLLAVFVPTLFMPGIVGRIYSQFAVTISVAVALSSVNALTLSPALCCLLLRQRETPTHGILALFERGIGAAGDRTTVLVRRLLPYALWNLVLIAGMAGGIGFLAAILPTGFLPIEDQGYLMIDVQLPDGASLQRTEETTQFIEEALRERKEVAHSITVNGYSILNGGGGSNTALIIVTLTPWSQRTAPSSSAQALQRSLTRQFNALPAATIVPFNPPSIPGLGTMAGVEMKLQQTGGGTPQDLAAVTGALVYELNQNSAVGQASTPFRANLPQIFVALDREKIKLLDVKLSDVFLTLQAYLGGYPVNDFNLFSRVYKVILQAEGEARRLPEDIGRLYVRSAQGTMVPMEALAEVEMTLGPQLINRYNMFPSASVNSVPSPGVATGTLLRVVEEVSRNVLPEGIRFEWTGIALQQSQTQGVALFIFGLALIFGYLFLVAQYESWSMPIAIMLSVSIALLGAFIGVWFVGGEVNLYTQIGMILLIGLGAKNAILLVEFAMEQRRSGFSIAQAALEAVRLRFRAVMMTALSFLFGVIPLLHASGAGAVSQNALGIAVFSGILFAATLGVLLIPLLYAAVQTLRESLHRRLFKASSSIPKAREET